MGADGPPWAVGMAGGRAGLGADRPPDVDLQLRGPCEEGTTPVTAAGRGRSPGSAGVPGGRSGIHGNHPSAFGSRQDGDGRGLRAESGAKDGSGSPAGQRGGAVGAGGVAGLQPRQWALSAPGSWTVGGSVTVTSHRPGLPERSCISPRHSWAHRGDEKGPSACSPLPP